MVEAVSEKDRILSEFKIEPIWVDLSLHPMWMQMQTINYDVYIDKPYERQVSKPNQEGLFLDIEKTLNHKDEITFPNDDSRPDVVEYMDCVVCHATVLHACATTDNEFNVNMTMGLCPKCGFFQLSRRPTREFYKTFYSSIWNPKRSEEENWPEQIQQNPMVFNLIQPYLTGRSKICEIGPGWGNMLAPFLAGNNDCYGIEATDHRARFLKERFNINCAQGQFEDIQLGENGFEEGSFDFIYSHHVIEHVYNPRQVVELTYRLLKPGGYTFISLPRVYGEHLVTNAHGMAHTCSFSQENLQFLLNSIGFHVVRDVSDFGNLSFLAKKTEPMDEIFAKLTLDALSKYVPQRNLAFLLYNLGLSGLPTNLTHDVKIYYNWQIQIQGKQEAESFYQQWLTFESREIEVLNKMRKVIKERVPIEVLSEVLPIYCMHRGPVPIWYY